jgi:ATP-binding cassette subfamily B protein
MALSATIGSIGVLYLFASVRWWLLLTILIPFGIDAWFGFKYFYNIYDELEHYWKKERKYGILGNILKARDYVKENRLFQSTDFLIDTYRERLSARNHEYEGFYFKHLSQRFTKRNIIKLAQFGNALLLLMLYLRGGINIGLLISLTLAVFHEVFDLLGSATGVLQWSGMHIKTFDFYDKYFALSEDEYGGDDTLPEAFTIEFDNVRFTYPGTDREILKGLCFTIGHGERVSIVGENGEGKTTMIKLLLGLFQPTSGEIRVGGKPLSAYSQAVRSRMFGPVFQDFIKYSISLRENIGVGDIEKAGDTGALETVMKKTKVDDFAGGLSEGVDTLLGRDFEGGVDLSGGQWQRIAIARAFMGDKPILILDEPTSQLDPMAESRIYSEFAEMSSDKTAVFITHRLGSTMITDRILVISGGVVTESGSHEELTGRGGLYADMWNSQKQWYVKSAEKENTDANA